MNEGTLGEKDVITNENSHVAHQDAPAVFLTPDTRCLLACLYSQQPALQFLWRSHSFKDREIYRILEAKEVTFNACMCVFTQKKTCDPSIPTKGKVFFFEL